MDRGPGPAAGPKTERAGPWSPPDGRDAGTAAAVPLFGGVSAPWEAMPPEPGHSPCPRGGPAGRSTPQGGERPGPGARGDAAPARGCPRAARPGLTWDLPAGRTRGANRP
jgi:hypothetical protein